MATRDEPSHEISQDRYLPSSGDAETIRKMALELLDINSKKAKEMEAEIDRLQKENAGMCKRVKMLEETVRKLKMKLLNKKFK